MTAASTLADALLSALDALDVADAPHGLYAGHDLEPDRAPTSLYREWNAAVRPALVTLGATDFYARSPFARLLFQLPELGDCELLIRRIATVKVRRFGSAHRVDDRTDRTAQWAAADVASLLNGLKYPRAGRPRRFAMLVIIGFTPEAKPLARELRELARETKGLESVSRAWPDRYGRALSVGLNTWWAPLPVAQD